jgi:hypothetical protein
MAETFDIDSMPVLFNMDLANGPTSLRYCQEAFDVLRSIDKLPDLNERKEYEVASFTYGEECDPELVSDAVAYWDDQLSAAGFYSIWNASDDVVVFDLRALPDDQRGEFYRAAEDY